MTAFARKEMRLWDGALSYLEWPAEGDAPTLVFLHATGFHALTYRALLAPLAGGVRILAPDQRGHGHSTLAADPALMTGWTVYRDDLIRFLDGLDGRAVHLAGHSLGGVVAAMAAARRPELVRGLVLADPVFVPPGVHLMVRWASALGFGRWFGELSARAKRRRAFFAAREEARDAWRGRGAFRSWPEETFLDHVEGALLPLEGGGFRLACAPEWEAVSFRMTPAIVRAVAGKIRAPVTVLYAERGTAPASEARTFARLHGNTRLIRVPRTSHFLPMEAPELVRGELRRMLGV